MISKWFWSNSDLYLKDLLRNVKVKFDFSFLLITHYTIDIIEGVAIVGQTYCAINPVDVINVRKVML